MDIPVQSVYPQRRNQAAHESHSQTQRNPIDVAAATLSHDEPRAESSARGHVIKQTVKSALRGVVAVIGPHRWRRGPCLLVLTYHRVLPKGYPARETEQPGMLVSPALLAMHFEVLKRHFTPVHLDDWLRAAKAGDPPPGRSLAITFDDGWRDNYDHAFPVLQAAGMPATIFLVTDMVGSHYQFWPNRLFQALKVWEPRYDERLDDETRRQLAALGVPLTCVGTDLTCEQIDTAIARCKATDDASMHGLLDRLEAALSPVGASDRPELDRDLVSWAEVRTMAASGLVRFGSHTRRHTRLLDSLSPQVLDDEIKGSRRLLEAKINQPVELFCYPNGDTSDPAYRRVKAAYQGATCTRRGWHAPRMDPYMIRRIGVHEDVTGTPSALLARVSGWRAL